MGPAKLKLFLSLLAGVSAILAQPSDIAALRAAFVNPPPDARIMMRWWWFGAAVDKPELERELRLMKEGGIGGVEIQPVYPLALDDPETGFRNLPYLSDGFIDAVRFASEKARELGLRVDITLGSGWPYGGPHIPITEAAGKLRVERVAAPPEAHSVPLPDVGNGEKLIAVFLARADARRFETFRQLTSIEGHRLRLPADTSTGETVLFFISSRTGMQVKRPAVGAEGFVLDHYDRAAIEHHLKVAGERLLQAFGEHPPYAVFSDSLEVYVSDWTPDFLAEFRKRRGYDLTPLLPALAGDIGERTAAIRRDWGRTLTELAEERYLTPIREWARQHGTRFRSQTYGEPPVILSSNALVDLPEGEGWQWRSVAPSRWAASASHLYGRPVTSSETWTWLHSPAFRATPLDMKAEADLHFLQGINQLIGHGWPYSPPSAGEPGWRFYAAAVFNAHNPWWIVMPDVTRYLQRISFVLRQGKPANDVAVYLPTKDAWSQFTLGRTSVNRSMDRLLGPDLIPAILDAGYNFDFIDDRAIERVGVPYAAVVLPAVKSMPRETGARLDEFKRRGGIVIEGSRVGELPKRLTPDFAAQNPAIGFVHRKLPDADIYFVANTGNQPVHTTARVRVKESRPEWWDPFTGEARGAEVHDGGIKLDLEPYESRVLVFSKNAAAPASEPGPTQEIADLSSDWNVSFSGLAISKEMRTLASWDDDEATQYYSGQTVYEKQLTVSKAARAVLDFGAGTPVAPNPRPSAGPAMRALLESPVREAALVYINGQLAGSVWHPPYQVDVTKLIRAGANTIRIVAANLAINELAGQTLPDYKLLNLRYGVRFTPQDMQNVKPLPSGLLGPVKLFLQR